MEHLTITQYRPGEHRQRLEAMLRADPYYLDTLESVKEHPHGAYVAQTGGDTVGLLSLGNLEQTTFATVYVDRAHRKKGVGAALIGKAHSILSRSEAVVLSVCSCPAEDRDALQFLYRRGYSVSFSSYTMERTGPPLPAPGIRVRQYEDGDYSAWHDITSRAFYHMRGRAGILPAYYHPPGEQGRKSLLSSRENRFVMLYSGDDRRREGEIVATGAIEGNELDSIAVRCDLHGKGYGKAFAAYLVNTILERGNDTACLWVVQGNHAKQLYEKLGFRETGLYSFLSRYYRPDTRLSAPPAS